MAKKDVVIVEILLVRDDVVKCIETTGKYAGSVGYHYLSHFITAIDRGIEIKKGVEIHTAI